MIQVSFKPASAGTPSGMLTLTANPGGTLTFIASATALTPPTPAALTLAPTAGSSLDFGAVPVGMPTAAQPYVVTNTGQQSTTPILVTLDNADFTFVPTDGDCVSGVTSLMPNETCLVHVQFQPGRRSRAWRRWR